MPPSNFRGHFFLIKNFSMDLLIFQAPILMVQASMDGILLGILFALIAYGMALQWGVMNIINIAQGDLVILRWLYCVLYVSLRNPSCMGSDSFSSNYVFCGYRNLQISYQ